MIFLFRQRQPGTLFFQLSFISMMMLMILMMICVSAPLMAQRAESAGPRDTVYVDEPFEAAVGVEGFEEEPVPECVIENVPDGVKAEVLGANPQISSSIQVINGRMTQRRSVIYRYPIRIIASKPGRYTLGPFKISQNGKTVSARAITFTVKTVELDPDMRVSLELPARKIYPGEKVPVIIRWRFAGELNSVRNLRIYSELFDSFRFEDEPTQRGDQALPIQTKEGALQLKADVSRETIDGKEFLTLTAKRSFTPDRPGEFTFPPISASIQKVTRWQRDFFGDASPAAYERKKAQGSPLKLTVAAAPENGKPPAYAGAIGEGFSIEVSADRSVVREGDPIALTVTLKGKGNLSAASLPDLKAAGLSPQQFKLPDGNISGEMKDGQKVFTFSVRAIAADITQIPPITYAWFNPTLGQYESVTSAPIALQVEKAKRVTAKDVSGVKPEEGDKDDSAQSEKTKDSRRPQRDRQDFTDLNLAIPANPDQYASRGQSLQLLEIILCVLGLLTIPLAYLSRRYSQRPEEVIARDKRMREVQSRLSKATGHTPEAAGEIASALQILLPDSGEHRQAIERCIANLDAIRYAPAGVNYGDELKQLYQTAQSLLGKVRSSS